MSGATPPLPHYAFMVWCLVKHKDNSTSTSTGFKITDLGWLPTRRHNSVHTQKYREEFQSRTESNEVTSQHGSEMGSLPP
jgi:hypothetical protein